MNLIFTSVLVAIGICSCSCSTLLEIVLDKCNRNENNDAFHNTTDVSIKHLSECIENANVTLISFCELYGNSDIYTCLNNFSNKISSCLLKEEEYLPNFVLTVFNASLARSCDEDGSERMDAYLENLLSSPCLSNYLYDEFSQSRCFIDLQTLLYKATENYFILKKDDLCSYAQFLKSCIIETLQDRCNKDPTEAISYLVDPYLSPCENLKASTKDSFIFYTGAAHGKFQFSILQHFYLSGIWILLYNRF